MKRADRQGAARAVSDALIALRRIERRGTGGDKTVCGVTPSQGALIHEVAIAEDQLPTTADLAGRLGISSPGVTQIVDVLTERGVLARVHDTSDRRRVRVGLTTQGRALYGLFDRARMAQASELLEPLSDAEVDQLASLLSKLARTNEDR